MQAVHINMKYSNLALFLGFLRYYQTVLIILLPPLLFLPLPLLVDGQESQAGYILLIMVVYWCTEAVPIPVTSLIPVFIVPLFGISTAAETATSYLENNGFLVSGGFIMAIAIENSNAHRRIAIKAVMASGGSPRWLVLGFALPTFLLSMWIVNTASVSMIVPIVEQVLRSLELAEEAETDSTERDSDGNLDVEAVESPTTVYIIDKRLWTSRGCESSPINFASWMIMALPLACINMLIIWLWIEIVFVGFKDFCGKEDEQSKRDKMVIQDVLRNEYTKLGALSVAEIQTCIVFVAFALLLFLQDPGFMPGWGSFFDGNTAGSTPAICISFLLFVIPEHYEKYSDKKAEALVPWSSMKERFPFEMLFLLGGSVALGDAVVKSGLADVFGEQLSVLRDLPDPVLVIILGAIATIITQFTSNLAAGSILLPVAASMSESMGKSPLFLMLPVAIAVQFAFMLPIATIPNAIAYASGRITILDMVKAGSFLNIVCVLVMALGVFTWGDAYFDLNTLPWDQCANSTAAL